MTIIYGGSFNPPTIAHYEIAKYILNKFPKSNLIFLPTANSYKKNDLGDFYSRVEMLEILASKLGKRASVSDFEGKLDKYYGTYYSLSQFENPYFVIGADNLMTIDTWINYPRIVQEFKFIVIPRDDLDIAEFINSKVDLKNNRDNFIILDEFKKIDLSSSIYRLSKDSKLLLEEVADYIKNNNLYKEIK